MAERSGTAGVRKALLRIGATMRSRNASDPLMAEILASEAVRVLGDLPDDALQEAVSRCIDGRAGDGTGWAPTLVELKRVAEEVVSERAATDAHSDDAVRRAAIRSCMGNRPVFVKRDSPQWDRWQEWLKANNYAPMRPMQTINGFGNYTRSVEPPAPDAVGAA